MASAQVRCTRSTCVCLCAGVRVCVRVCACARLRLRVRRGEAACVCADAARTTPASHAELAALLPAGIGIVGTYGSPRAAELAPPGATLAVAAEREDVADGGDVHVHWRLHGADAVADVRDVHAVNSLLARERVVLRARAELLLRPSSPRRGGEGEGEEDAVERAEAEAVDAVNTLLAPPLAFAFPEGAGEGEGAAPVLVDVGACAHDGAEGPICEDVCGRGTAAMMQRRVASAGTLQVCACVCVYVCVCVCARAYVCMCAY